MAESIKGISILIEGDTTGLSKALAGVNKSSRDIQYELKQVEKLLKLDPENTELLAQKQALLTNAVANTKDKLDSLKKAQEQVNEQFARGEINEGQYRAFQREIAATEQELRRYEAQISKADEATDKLGDSTEGTGDKFQTAGEKMKGAGEMMSVGITAPITAAGGLMLKGAVDAQMAQGKLQASLGLTAEEAEKLGGIAKDVWKDGFGESIGEVDAAISVARKNMAGLSDEELKSVTEGAMTIADVFEADVTDSTKAAGSMMKNFGISGQDALDLITVGFQKGGDYSGELLDTLNEYSPQFASMGMSADQMMGILIAGAQAGSFSLDKVGDSLKEFNLRAQDGSKSTAEGFAAIGLNAEQMGLAIAKGGEDGQKAFMATVAALAAMKDPVQQNTAGVALFGSQWEDVRKNVITAMADGVKGIGDFKGATEAATKAINDSDPGSAFVSAMRELQVAIGPALLPIAEIIKNTIAPAIKSLADWFTNLSPAGQKTVLAIAGIAAAIGPLMVILGPIISAIGGIIGAFGAVSAAMAGGATGIGILTTAFPVLGTVISGIGAAFAALTWPIGLAIAAIAAVAVIIIYWEPIKAFFSNLWNGIKSVFSGFWEWLKGFFSKWGVEALAVLVPFIGIPLLIVKHWDDIKAGLSAAWEWIKTTVVNIFNSVLTSITAWGTSVMTWITTEIPLIINGIVTFFGELPGKIGYALGYAIGTLIKWGADAVAWVVAEVPKIITGIVTFFSELPSKLATVFTNVMTGIAAWGTNVITWITTEVPKFIAGIITFFAELPGKLAAVFTNVMTGIGAWGTNVISWITTEVPKFISGIVDYFSELPGKIMAFLSQVLTNMGTWIGNMASSVASEIPKIITTITDFFGSLPGKMSDIGSNIVKGLWDGISGMVSWFAEKIRNFAAGFVQGLKDALGIKSPSKITTEIGQYTGQGLALGMANTVGEVSRQANALASAAIPKGASGSYDGATGGSGSRMGNSTSNSIGALLQVDKIVIANDMDIQDLANKLGFYWLQTAAAKGGR